MSICTTCPNACKIDRDRFIGGCGVKNDIVIAKYYLHPYEEPPVSGTKGSGCVFFGGCSLKCAFCQNYELSHNGRGKVFSVQELADIFRKLEQDGAHNVNLVNPTHYSLQIIKALQIYRPKIPIVWNTHGYESLETLNLVNSYVDVYLTDLKYFKSSRSFRYAKKQDYFAVAEKAVKFMLNAKKPIMEDGLIKQGVIVRHLILPQNVDESFSILEFLKDIIGDNYLSLMSQYTPYGDLTGLPELKRKITAREYRTVLDKALSLGFKNMFLQDESSAKEDFIPTWDF